MFFAMGRRNNDAKDKLMNRNNFISFGLKNSKPNFCFCLILESRRGIAAGNSFLICSLEIKSCFLKSICAPHLEQTEFPREFILPHPGHRTDFGIEFPNYNLGFITT